MQRNDSKAIFSRRLLRARRMRGMSLRALAEATTGKVSHNALSRYEKGIMLPGSKILLAVSKALNQKPDYFFRPFEVQLDGIKFRKVSKLSKKYRHSIEEAAFDYVERYSEIEQILGLETLRQNPIESLLVQVPDDVEGAAEQLRKGWHLGEDPLASTIEISEGNGVKVVEVDSPKEFDGLSGQANNRPVIVLAKWLKDDLARKRLTLLHEVGHLLLRFSSVIDERTEEKICYRFAGAMLIPK